MIQILLVAFSMLNLSGACTTFSHAVNKINVADSRQFQEILERAQGSCMQPKKIILSGNLFIESGSSAFEAIFIEDSDFRMNLVSPFGDNISEMRITQDSSGQTLPQMECRGKCSDSISSLLGKATPREIRSLVCGLPELLRLQLPENPFRSKNALVFESNFDFLRQRAQVATSLEPWELWQKAFEHSQDGVDIDTEVGSKAEGVQHDRIESLPLQSQSCRFPVSAQTRLVFGWLLKQELILNWEGCVQSGYILPTSLKLIAKDMNFSLYLNEFERVTREFE